MLTKLVDITNPRAAAGWLTAQILVLSMMLLGEAVTVETIVAVVLMGGIAVISLTWAYRRDAIVRWYKDRQYSRTIRRHT